MQVDSGLPPDKLTDLGKVSSYFRLFPPTFLVHLLNEDNLHKVCCIENML